jgi:hypothetical protein
MVMAMLQAARAKRLGLEDDSAYSWGLNRAIFYAAAKAGFRGGGGGPPKSEGGVGGEGAGAASRARGSSRSDETYQLGDELAYRDPDSRKLYFAIGGETQTEKEFHRQIAERFGTEANFRKAWSEALEIVERFDEATLRSGRRFYSDIYKPRRDELVESWTEKYVGTPSET